MRKNKGFTFLEILVATMIIGLSFWGSYLMLTSGQTLLRAQKVRTEVMNSAVDIMRRVLSHSYQAWDGLVKPTINMDSSRGKVDIIRCELLPPIKKYESIVGGFSRAPYYDFVVQCSNDQDGSITKKTVRLHNIIRYPDVHSMNVLPQGAGVPIPWGDATGPVSFQQAFSIPNVINFEEEKNIYIFYTLVLRYGNVDNVLLFDTIHTRLYIDGYNSSPLPPTQTPILTYPVINGLVGFINKGGVPGGMIASGSHNLVLEWFKATDSTDPSKTDVQLESFEAIIIAVSPPVLTSNSDILSP